MFVSSKHRASFTEQVEMPAGGGGDWECVKMPVGWEVVFLYVWLVGFFVFLGGVLFVLDFFFSDLFILFFKTDCFEHRTSLVKP